jgi:hypothetical protein
MNRALVMGHARFLRSFALKQELRRTRDIWNREAEGSSVTLRGGLRSAS